MMNEEKKLTDEEIVKALECCVKEEHKDCVHCGEFVSQFDCMRNVINNALDLIQRQKAEIERLTRELDDIVSMNKMYIKTVEQNTELQKQVDELKVGRENVQKILDELGKCGNDNERYAVWVKLIKYCGVEVE